MRASFNYNLHAIVEDLKIKQAIRGKKMISKLLEEHKESMLTN